MAYRSEEESLKARREQIERELDAVRRSRSAAEANAEAASEQDAQFLNRVRVAAPCNVSWDSMTGDDRTRFCGDCKKNVYNLSAMTSAEAMSFLQSQSETPCVRFYKRADGTMLTSDCPVGVKKKRVRLAMVGGVGGALLAAGATLLGIRAKQQHVMGEMAPLQGAVALPPQVGEPIPEQHVMGKFQVAPEATQKGANK